MERITVYQHSACTLLILSNYPQIHNPNDEGKNLNKEKLLPLIPQPGLLFWFLIWILLWSKYKQMSWIRYWLFYWIDFSFFSGRHWGITRLTGSGLSITKWDIVTGTIPPLSDTAWVHEFEVQTDTAVSLRSIRYDHWSVLNGSIFWEYLHRLWARTMGFVFLIPFIIFYAKRWISPHLYVVLGVVVALAMLAATFGWIMVASGLVDRPWVNAYKLSFHLCILFPFTQPTLDVFGIQERCCVAMMGIADKLSFAVLVVLWVQLFLGGIMCGMKAGLFYPMAWYEWCFYSTSFSTTIFFLWKNGFIMTVRVWLLQ